MARNSRPKKKSLGAELGDEVMPDLQEQAPVSETSFTAAQTSPVAGGSAHGHVPYRQVTIFLRQLIMLLESGVPLLRGLKTMSERTSGVALKNLIKDIGDSVESGNALWQSFARHPRHFDDLFVNLVKAGEASGNLTMVIERIVSFRGKKEQIRRHMRAALAYPAVVSSAALVLFLGFCFFIIPMFKNMYEELGTMDKVGGMTMAVFRFGDFVRNFAIWAVPLAVVVAIVGYKLWKATPAGRLVIDGLKLKLPIIKKISMLNAVVEFSTTFGMLLSSGISMLVTLDLTRDAISNKAFALVIGDIKDSVERGEGLEPALRKASVVPGEVTEMLVTGEESGSLDTICNKIADLFQDELDMAVGTLQSMIEPFMILLLGVIVMFMILGLFLPYISMISAVTGV